ncbi:MAG TPA: hypothetical protein VLH61_09850 [Bacteroidales bacterium]|nr:hypothetical protein [Bacteroidales bacterium]
MVNFFKIWPFHSKVNIERHCNIRYFILPVLLVMTLFIGGCAGEFEDPFEDPVEKFLGNWKATETSIVFGSGYVYDVSISRISGRFSEVYIQNFYMQGQDQRARALVTGNNLNIFEQTIANGTIAIKGSGQFSAGVITINYTANSGADLDVVTAILRRPV